MSKKYHIRERSFLNLKTDMRAYIIGVIEDTRNILPCCGEHGYYSEIELKMADCIEEISFDFDLSTQAERENSLFKIRKIAEIVNAFREGLEAEAAIRDARETIVTHDRAMSAVH